MLYLLVICVLVGIICRWALLFIFDLIFKTNKEPTYIDNSVHYHNHLHVGDIDEITSSSDERPFGID